MDLGRILQVSWIMFARILDNSCTILQGSRNNLAKFLDNYSKNFARILQESWITLAKSCKNFAMILHWPCMIIRHSYKNIAVILQGFLQDSWKILAKSRKFLPKFWLGLCTYPWPETVNVAWGLVVAMLASSRNYSEHSWTFCHKFLYKLFGAERGAKVDRPRNLCSWIAFWLWTGTVPLQWAMSCSHLHGSYKQELRIWWNRTIFGCKLGCQQWRHRQHTTPEWYLVCHWVGQQGEWLQAHTWA